MKGFTDLVSLKSLSFIKVSGRCTRSRKTDTLSVYLNAVFPDELNPGTIWGIGRERVSSTKTLPLTVHVFIEFGIVNRTSVYQE